MIYLDNNATTRPLQSVIDAVAGALGENWGNPSSTHSLGARAREAVEHAREQVASVIGCSPREVVWTSGGTESCNHALRAALAMDSNRKLIVTSAIEHAAISECADHLETTGQCAVLRLGRPGGVVDPGELDALLQREASRTALVSVMWVNNETGLIQPVGELAQVCRRHGVRFHTDAVQAVGKISIDLRMMEVDLLSISSHKIHGPKGTGALFVRRGVALGAVQLGGAQERGRRGGTENVPGIIGCGVAADAAAAWMKSNPDPVATMQSLRREFESRIVQLLPTSVVQSRDEARLWTTSNIAWRGLSADAIVLALSRMDVAASAGAACSTGSLEGSPVLVAMGVDPDLAQGAVRFSFSRQTTREELLTAADRIAQVIGRVSQSMA